MLKYLVSANGNSFVVLPDFEFKRLSDITRIAAEHHVDGVVILRNADAFCEMTIFDRDGTYENMCGNALRSSALIAHELGYTKRQDVILTGDGLKKVHVNGIAEADIGQIVDKGFISDVAGVPHLVLNKTLNPRLDKLLRDYFNANITSYWKKGNSFFYRTFEVGVEDYTKSCGTGAAAVAHKLGLESVVLNAGEGKMFVRKEGAEFFISGDSLKVDRIY